MNPLRYLPFARRAFVRAGPPVHLTVYVTGACNLRCRHCFHFEEVAAGTPGPSLAELERLAASAARAGPLLWVSLGGGEPFLRPDLPEIGRAFGERGLRHLAIPTNGLVRRQDEVVARLCRESPDTYVSVAVSIDGPPDVHDAIRQVEGGHARAVASARRLLALKRRHPNLGVGLIVCVTRENQDVLAAHVEELARELAPDNLTINLARGTALDPSLLEVDVARYREVVAAKKRLRHEGVLPYFRFPLARLAAARDELVYEHVARFASGDRSRHLPCTAGTLSAVVFEDGSVHPCEVLGEPIGSLRDVDWDLARLWRSERARELRAWIAETRCACTWECAQADNVLFRARSWPRLAARAAGTLA